MKKAFRVALPLFVLLSVALAAQPQIAYIIPDIGTPGMNTYVEIVAPVGGKNAFGTEGMSAPNAVSIEFVNRADSNFIVVSPVVVSWEGRLISCQFFVKPYAPLRPYPFRVRVNATRSNVDTFFVQSPQTFGTKNGGGVIGSGGAWGSRSKRGAMIVDSLVLNSGLYSFDTQTDPDPAIAGHQGYLPAIILSKGPVRINPGATVSADATEKHGGPGGGGGGGYGSGGRLLGIIQIPGERNTPLGNGYAGGKSSVTVAPSPATSFGLGTGADSRSLNGVEANNGYQPNFPTIRGYAAGPGHPFDSDGRSGGASALVIGTNTLSFGQYFGGGGNAQKGGGGFPQSEDYLNGQIVGNKELVPLHGGGGGAGGGPNDSVGAGGGGGLAIYSQMGITVADIHANGAEGSDGCANCSPISGKASGGGAGGSVIVGGKLEVRGTGVGVAGGNAGLTQEPARSNGSVSGSGGAGRFRHDGRISGTGLTVTAGASRYVGPTIDTLSFVGQPIFTVRGTGSYAAGKGANIWVFVRGEDMPWNYASPYTTVVRPDSTWEVEVGVTTTDSLLYVFAVQLTDPAERDPSVTTEWTRIPTHIFSQAAANIVRYRPAPVLSAPSTARFDTLLCAEIAFDTIIVRNTGAGVLEIEEIRTSAPALFTVASPTNFPHRINPGELDTIILRFDGITAPYGPNSGTISIISNDPAPGKSPWDIQVSAFKVHYEYIDPDPDNPPTVDFGEVSVGSSLDRQVVVRNITSVVVTDLVVDSLWVSPPTPGITTISRSIPGDTPIKPGESLTVEIRYSPTQEETLGPVFLCARIAQPCPDTICWPLTGKGVRSSLSYSKSSLSMTVPLCSPRTDIEDTVVLSNTGSATLDISSITVSPLGTFSVVGPTVPPIAQLAPGASREVIVRYSPGAATRATGTLTIVTNDLLLDTLKFDLNGAWDSVGMEFSTHSVGLFSFCPGALVDSVVRIRNTGSVEDTVRLEYSGGSDPFTISPSQPNYIIPPGGEIAVTISFAPTAQGTVSAYLLVRNEPCNLLDSIFIEGGLTSGAYSVQPQPLAFGDVRTGSPTQRVAIVDNSAGSGSIRVASARIVPPTPELVVSPTQAFPIRVAAGGTANVALDYIPVALAEIPPGTYLEIIIDSLCADTLRTEVTGRGVNGTLLADPSPLNFGGVYSCLTEVDTIHIRNVSPAAVTILDVQVDPTPGEFTAVLADPSNPTPQLGPNESFAVVVRFDPSAPPDGLKNAALKVTTTDPNVGTFEVQLRGNRLSESLTITGPAFTPTFAGATDVQRLQIVNNGTTSIPINNLLVSPPFRIVQTIPPLTHLLNPGGTLFVDVEFAPAFAGMFEDSIEVEALTICGPIRLPISGESPTTMIADAYWEGITGEPGQSIQLPLKLTADVTGMGITRYSIDAKFNARMLLPRRVVLDATLSNGWTVTSSKLDTGFVSFSATGPAPIEGSGTLAYVEMLVLLGDDLTTPIISSDTSRFTTGGAQLKIAPGLFTLEGYCTVGGNRLVRITNNFGIKSVAPNPTRDRIAVDFELVEDGRTSLALYDMLGRRVALLLEDEMTAQPHHLEAQITLPQGAYILELRTPTQRQQAGIVVGR